MKTLIKVLHFISRAKNIATFLLVSAFLLAVYLIVFTGLISGDLTKPNSTKINGIVPIISAIVVPIIMFATGLLVVETYKSNNYQNISNIFFKMIDQNRHILAGVNCDTSGLSEKNIQSKGKDFFDDLAELIAMYYRYVSYGDKPDDSKEIDEELFKKIRYKREQSLLLGIYDHYYHVHQSDLGHYFRNLYYIVWYIDSSNLSKDKKIQFLRILRSQLSNYEILMLAYNGLHPYGEDFRKYIEDYELIKSLNNEERLPDNYVKRIIDPNVLLEAYPHLKKYW